MDLQTVQNIIKEHKDELRAFGITRVGIFGSTVSGTATPQSDIDLILDFDPQKKHTGTFWVGPHALRHSWIAALTL